MGIRTRIDEIIHSRLQKLGQNLGQNLDATIPQRVKALSKELWRNPRALSGMLEEKSPWLSRQVLGAASNIAEPFVAGMGLRVEELGEDSVTIFLPGWWRNQGDGGFIHSGAVCTLAEFTARIYWEYHLDLRRSEMTLLKMQLVPVGATGRVGLNQLKGNLRARYHVPVGDRERLLHELRAKGETVVEGEIAVYDEGQKLVGQLEVEWRLRRQLALGEASKV